MDIYEIRPHITAVIPKDDVISRVGSNVGLIHTDEGIILVDTTVSPARMQMVLDATGVLPEDVCLVINTHNHADHINGNSLFHCPVLCHNRAKASMGKKCAKLGQELIIFDKKHEVDVGNVHLELIHTGGHTPDSFVVWLPEDRVLFSSDLIFSGRMPFLASVTNFNALIINIIPFSIR